MTTREQAMKFRIGVDPRDERAFFDQRLKNTYESSKPATAAQKERQLLLQGIPKSTGPLNLGLNRDIFRAQLKL